MATMFAGCKGEHLEAHRHVRYFRRSSLCTLFWRDQDSLHTGHTSPSAFCASCMQNLFLGGERGQVLYNSIEATEVSILTLTWQEDVADLCMMATVQYQCLNCAVH